MFFEPIRTDGGGLQDQIPGEPMEYRGIEDMRFGIRDRRTGEIIEDDFPSWNDANRRCLELNDQACPPRN